MPIRSLMTRPLDESERIESLAASIRDQGLKFPILVQPDGLVIDGARRVAAMELLGATEIGVEIRSDYLDVCEYITRVRNDGYLATPLTPERIMWIKSALAPNVEDVIRRTKNGPGRKFKPTDPVTLAGGTTASLAKALGKSKSWMSDLVHLYNIQADPNLRGYRSEVVTKTMEHVKSGKLSPQQGLERIKGTSKVTFEGDIIRPADQRQVIVAAGSSIRGLVRGMTQLGPLSPELSKEELVVSLQELESVRRVLTKLINGISEEINQR